MLNTAVVSVKEDGGEVVVEVEDGGSMRAKKVVVATEGPQAAKLLGSALERAPSQEGDPVGTACLYFSADEPPRKGNYLYLDGGQQRQHRQQLLRALLRSPPRNAPPR